mgnify:CR=1 FL=1
MTLLLTNTLTGKKEAFAPRDPQRVTMYACGPTVYNYAHIGNARMAVVFDLLARVLRHLYPQVVYVSNITDVDDKIIAASRETGEAIGVITEKYTEIYNRDMAALGVQAPDVQPRATAHIAEMIALIEALIKRDHAYAADGHVLFHVPSFPAYGGLSGRSRDEQIAGARVEVASYKKDPADFVLWKPSSGDEPGWDSPWGFGRPGWHIECSAMAEKHLGLPFDIHGGGADLKFPHHENEIAQSCCAHGKETDLSAFAKVWVHNGFVTVEGEKMSKSLGNVLLVHDLIQQYPGEVLRLALLSAHYRQPLDWTQERLKTCRRTLDGLYRILLSLKDIEAPETPLPPAVQKALEDDLNTPQVINALHHLARTVATIQDPAQLKTLKGQILSAGRILGLLQSDPAAWFSGATAALDTAQIAALMTRRDAARAAKNFALSDELRDELLAMGVMVEDSKDGSRWRAL